MSPKKVREKGQSKDTDKLIRRLSLVALLLSRRGQPVSAAEIRSRVEGYPTMTDEAFKRRFYEDRDELRRLGIEIRTDEDPLSETSSELYSLPADAYYLEPVALDGDELAALAACLAVLEDRFAYSQPLRLALLSLAQGRPELLTEAEAPPLMVVPIPGAERRPAQAAGGVAERKTVEFDYYAITRDETIERVVDPYGLQLVAGEWYLIGWCHLREDLRTFRLSRVRSGVKYHTRRPHDFAPARRLRPVRLPRPPRLAAGRAPGDGARARLPGHGVVGRGALGPLRHRARARTTARSCTRHPTPTRGPLLGWVLGLADEAELLEPPDLRARLSEQLDGLAALLDAPAPERPARDRDRRAGAAAASQGRRRPARRGRPLHPSHRAGELPHAALRRRRGGPRRRRGARRPRRHRQGTARGRRPPQSRELRRRRPAALGRVRGPRQAERLVRVGGTGAGASRPPLPAAGRHAAPGDRAGRPPPADRLGRGPPERRRQDPRTPAAARRPSPAATSCSPPTRSSGTSTGRSWSGACSPSSTGPRAPTG